MLAADASKVPVAAGKVSKRSTKKASKRASKGAKPAAAADGEVAAMET